LLQKNELPSASFSFGLKFIGTEFKEAPLCLLEEEEQTHGSDYEE
jgi:hypothetical protein